MFQVIYYIILTITGVYALYFAITGILGIILKNRINKVTGNKSHKFGIVIPARNEEKVISNLIDSINKSDYPKDKFNIFVALNNTTDNTRNVCKSKDVTIINCKGKINTKGDALKEAFEFLKDEDIDAYLIFDADNVIHKDCLKEMNNILNRGYRVAEGYRDAKNPSDNWISGSYTIFYLIQNVFFNRSRMGFKASGSINGTCFMIKKELIDKEGFNTYTLTEDVEFTGQCALKKEKIAFAEKAITYDEYPNQFYASWKQRTRWSKGMIQCMRRYSFKLILDFFKTGNISSLDMGLVYMGPLIQLLNFINIIMLIISKPFGIEVNDIFTYIITLGWGSIISIYLGVVITEIFVLIYKRVKISKVMSGIILFGLFMITWIPINIICFCKKNIKWDVIKHERDIKIEDIKN